MLLQEAGKVVMEKFNGRISNIIAQAQKSAQKLIEIVVSNFTSYKDEAEFHGQKGTSSISFQLWLCYRS